MTKTIEEAAREFAKDRVGNYDYLGNEYEAYLDGNDDAVKWIMSLPLASRMTEEEKERAKAKYNAAKIGATECDSPECAYMVDLLEDIFGKAFFEEEGGGS